MSFSYKNKTLCVCYSWQTSSLISPFDCMSITGNFCSQFAFLSASHTRPLSGNTLDSISTNRFADSHSRHLAIYRKFNKISRFEVKIILKFQLLHHPRQPGLLRSTKCSGDIIGRMSTCRENLFFVKNKGKIFAPESRF